MRQRLERRIEQAPLGVLARAFFDQFFASESVTSDLQLRQAMIGILAFVILPGLFLLAQVFPAYQITAAVAAARHRPALIETALAQICLILVTYAMVAVGLIAVFTWDALTFSRRDALVLGPLPLRRSTIVTAKLAALTALLVGASAAVSVITAVPFTFTTVIQFSIRDLITHGLACLVAMLASGLFVFASLVVIRGAVMFVGRDRLAAAFGSVLQGLFVVVLLCFMVQLESGLRAMRSTGFAAGAEGLMPTAWFLGLFEWLLGATRPDYAVLAARALAAVAVTAAAAVAVSFASFRRHMQLAVASSGLSRPGGAVRTTRVCARLLAGPDATARAIADFTLLTLARERSQQVPVAVNTAIGVAVVISALSSRVHGLADLAHPRTAVLWIPLVLAYWLAIGMRAAFHVPANLRAAWVFRADLSGGSRSVVAGVRASLLAGVGLPVLALTVAISAPLYGWRLAAWHLGVVTLLIVLLVAVLTQTFPHVPFTRPYEPGHAKLKTRWWIYLLGMFAFAYAPAKVEVMLAGDTLSLTQLVGVLAAAVLTVGYVAGRSSHRRAIEWSEEESEEVPEMAVLNLSGLGMRV
ncbi:MAG: hypothetical protein KGN76_06590 [Acidobacteriota bacterium]|nr:hypothetical protein [Acidobacteriota bacterium]